MTLCLDADNLVAANYLFEMNKHLCMGHRVYRAILTAKTPTIPGLHARIPLRFGFQTGFSSFPDIIWVLAVACAVQVFV